MDDQPAGAPATGAFDTLETFAERSRRADEQTALIGGLPVLFERSVIYVAASALAVTLAILYVGRVQTTVEATGRVLPRGDVLSLQAAHGGVVLEMTASLGDYLPAGAVVARIDSAEAGLTLAQARHEQVVDEAQLRVLRASLARIDRVLASPDRLREERSAGGVAASTYPLLNGLDRAQIQLEAAQQNERLLPERRRQLEREHDLTTDRVALLERTLAGSRQALVRTEEERDAARTLAGNQLLSVVERNAAEERYRAAEMSLLSARQHAGELEVEISNTRLRLAGLQTSLQALDTDARGASRNARAEYDQAIASLRQERENVQMQVRALESKIQRTSQQVSVGEGRIELAVVTMPVAGTIAGLHVRNAGEIVSAGSPVVTIVPAGVPLIVQADLVNRNAGFIRPGVEARIKVDAFPFQQFGTARARVTRVLPAVGGGSGFVVQLDLIDETLRANGTEYRLFPGLSVQADLITGRQRLIDVLMQGQNDSGRAAPGPAGPAGP